ncbi:ABC transporter permease [Aquibacillus rhizosphaerae]|uniref:ABC transporter permease n=1 Tax=Aquibacillus rhizosphaerae TaxID=3051431 RepID=A0ABT7LC00_9BACI|nr:ABC transporter permease [Aquibacillus sp. LR5S19]MDL4842091.1 ABC transporter permease [Aquibacillus sp. LR5S19]
MVSVSRTFFFIKQYQKQLQKKWKSLPLLLLFPILIIGLCFFVVVSFFLPEEEQAIEIGLVDLDGSDETTMLVDMIDDATLLGSFIHIKKYTEQEAEKAIDTDKVSAYITFPENFTADLFQGRSVEVPIIGNSNNPVESYIINELINSMTRYIASAQANILTINQYAKQLPMEEKEREEMLFQQFSQFMLYTLSKDKTVHEEEITNLTTSSPTHYYSLAGWFVLITIWMLGMYILLGKEEGSAMWNRMKLYGVTLLQRITSRILVSLFYGLLLAMVGFYLFISVMDIEFYWNDYLRIAILISLYSVIFLIGLALIDLLFSSKKVSLITQICYTGLVLFLSGAIIPSLYFPEKVKIVVPYLFSNQAFQWLTEVAIDGRLYADYMVLILIAAASLCLLIACSMWKERVES